MRPRLSVPASVLLDDRIHQQEQSLKFWRGVFADALRHQEERRAGKRVER